MNGWNKKTLFVALFVLAWIFFFFFFFLLSIIFYLKYYTFETAESQKYNILVLKIAVAHDVASWNLNKRHQSQLLLKSLICQNRASYTNCGQDSCGYDCATHRDNPVTSPNMLFITALCKIFCLFSFEVFSCLMWHGSVFFVYSSIFVDIRDGLKCLKLIRVYIWWRV